MVEWTNDVHDTIPFHQNSSPPYPPQMFTGDRICRGLHAVLPSLENGHGPGGLEMNKYMFHFVYVPIAGIVFSNQSRTINYCFINGARLFILVKNIYVLGIHSHRHTDTQSSI